MRGAGVLEEFLGPRPFDEASSMHEDDVVGEAPTGRPMGEATSTADGLARKDNATNSNRAGSRTAIRCQTGSEGVDNIAQRAGLSVVPTKIPLNKPRSMRGGDMVSRAYPRRYIQLNISSWKYSH